jgi:foldase protein PrsA
VESGGFIAYNLEGYRRIKQILIKVSEEDATLISGYQSSGDTANLELAKQTALAKIKTKADEVLAKLKSGEDYDALLKQYNEDTGMENYPDGYAVGPKSTSYDTAFQEAAMKLWKVGDTTELVGTANGYAILKYASDISPAGAIPLAQIKDAAKKAALEKKQADFFTSLVEKWKGQAKIETFFDRM